MPLSTLPSFLRLWSLVRSYRGLLRAALSDRPSSRPTSAVPFLLRGQFARERSRAQLELSHGQALGTGYIRLQDFSETTNTELGEALNRLKASNMQRLVLDLRDNPGGPLDQAIAVANRFLKRGQMIVSTRGRIPNSDEDYHATEQGGFTDVPLIVVVNRGSASASKIVTGAMQDHDRGPGGGGDDVRQGAGTVGLSHLQQCWPRPDDRPLLHAERPDDSAAVGRQLRRVPAYSQHEQTGTRPHNAADLKLTDGQRKVYGGGGVEPDHFVVGPVDGFNPTRFTRLLSGRSLFVGFAERFTKEGDDRPGAQSAAKHRVAPGWVLSDAMVDEFHQYLVDQRVQIDEAAMKSDMAFVKAMIHFEVDVDLFGVEEARRTFSKVDPQLLAALGYFDEAAHLLTLNTSATAGQAVRAPSSDTPTNR